VNQIGINVHRQQAERKCDDNEQRSEDNTIKESAMNQVDDDRFDSSMSVLRSISALCNVK
jgi:hypothetical protein